MVFDSEKFRYSIIQGKIKEVRVSDIGEAFLDIFVPEYDKVVAVFANHDTRGKVDPVPGSLDVTIVGKWDDPDNDLNFSDIFIAYYIVSSGCSVSDAFEAIKEEYNQYSRAAVLKNFAKQIRTALQAKKEEDG